MLPTGGGAMRGIGEKFSANPANGTGSFSFPIAVTPARGLQPDLQLGYDSGAGNGPFGAGWHLSVPSITRKTDKQLPTYLDDTFVMSGAEDLVPCGGKRYRPRVEAAFARIERLDDGWRTTNAANVTSYFGRTDASRIVDPRDSTRVFSWLLDRSEDALGNVIAFEYVAEDLANVAAAAAEAHRLDGTASIANRYLKRIRYGNTVPYDDTSCLFEVVFDYGDHGGDTPVATSNLWPARADAFSSYRAGFEIRTYRLCRRVMMFHHIAELSPEPYLVGSTVFTYDGDPALAHLRAIEHRAHRDGETAAMPALRLHYTEAASSDELRTVTPERVAIDGARHRWVDLDGEGIPGVLTDADGGLYYRRNLGAGTLAPARPVPTRPSTLALAHGGQQLLDISGDGRLDLVDFAAPLPGFYERVATADGEGDWDAFQPFASQPQLAWSDPNVRFIDLDGDGREDILIVGDDTLVWYPSLGTDGYGPPRTLPRPLDEELGPTVVFTDHAGAVAMADLSGDGLRDLVRVENGRICYWPNLGHGKFGPKVTMAAAPIFDAPDQFDPHRVLFADIDGTGASDVLYARHDGVRYWHNLAGNAWGEPTEVSALPPDVKAASVTAVDLLGSGTACLVWSSTAPADSTIYYVDLTGTKPHLLDEIDNQLGLVTRLRYAPSTKFYLADRAAGIHWKTQLPFPVQVLDRVETYDAIRRVRFVSEYRYRDGYFDGYEREFRGFGYVEQRDTESSGASLGKGLFVDRPPPLNGEYPQPPVVTKTWFHTGAWFAGDRIVIEDGLTTAESRDAYRALRGSVLRQEVSCEDGKSDAPYTVTEHAYEVRCLQHADGDTHGVFFAHGRETLSWHFERDLTDPRITHELVVETDAYGHPRRTVAIGYPRTAGKSDTRPDQATLLATLTEVDVANEDHPAWYRHGVPIETRTYELTGLPTGMLAFEDVKSVADAAVAITYDGDVVEGACKRLVERARTRYYDTSALPAPLSFGKIDARAIAYQSYGLVFTTGLLARLYGGRVADSVLVEGGYIQDADGWWVPSGRAVPDPTQFYQPTQYFDPFGNPPTVVSYAHALVVTSVTDARGNATTADIDFRTMTPVTLTDPNGAVSQVELDVLGRVVSIWHVGRGEGDVPPAEPTVKFDYGFYDGVRPSFAHGHARESHADPMTRWQHTYSYFDGTGREIARKVQAEPGKAMQLENGQCIEVDANPRWIGTGRTVFDNKGNPLKQYEPYFSVTSDYEDEDALVCAGVTPLLHYDPIGRLILTERPDGSTMRVEFTPWRQLSYDANDTVGDPGNLWLARMQAGTAAERRAAALALEHAGTPSETLFDTLGRAFCAIADNKTEQLETRTKLDIEGNALAIIDPLGRSCLVNEYSMLGQPCHAVSIDAGERWTLLDVAGQPLRRWEAMGGAPDRVISAVYDALHRPTEMRVASGGADPMVVERIVYGEDAPDPAPYLRTRVYQTFDGAGVATREAYDFKGNVLSSTRQLAVTYDATLDWSKSVPLEQEVFRAISDFDALGRVVRAESPDRSVTWPSYNEASLLERVEVQLRGDSVRTMFVANIDYDAKRQRSQIVYGDADAPTAVTTYGYDALTYRLTSLVTTRTKGPLQDLSYTYDPTGNIVQISDGVIAPAWWNGNVTDGTALYTYDPVYRLATAQAREHAGGLAAPRTDVDLPEFALPNSNDDQALIPYFEQYTYNRAGNIELIEHGPPGISPAWIYPMQYVDGTNRLGATKLEGDLPDQWSGLYSYDARGNMTKMPHLPVIDWDWKDQMQRANKGGGGDVYFTYDHSGHRVRKVWVHGGTIDERIYLGGWEIYRRRTSNAVSLERETLHVMDGAKRIAMVETTTIDNGDPVTPASSAIRFQLGNHLGSAMVELASDGRLLSYEEYHPFGTTAYRAKSAAEVPSNRHRYTGKERDEETGIGYHGARYYAPWIARWTSPDPSLMSDGTNGYSYVNGNPVRLLDPDGRAGVEPEKKPPPPAPGAWDYVKAFVALSSPGTYKVVSGMAENISGAAHRAGQVATGLAYAAHHPIEAVEHIGGNMADEYKAAGGGVIGARNAVNTLNPFWLGAKAVQDATKAQLAGRREASGEHLFDAALQLLPGVKRAPGAPLPALVTADGTLVSAGEVLVDSAPRPPIAPLLNAAADASKDVTPPERQLNGGGKTTLADADDVAAANGTNKARGTTAEVHEAELQGGTAKQQATKTSKGIRFHDVRDIPLPNNTILRIETKNYKAAVRLSGRLRSQINKDAAWMAEGRALGEHRLVQWRFYNAGPTPELRKALEQAHIPYVARPGKTP